MAKRLVKIAKELNVGTSTIVEFLAANGHEVENKPTSKISDEMTDLLIKEFSGSMAVKQEADNLVIGSRAQEKEVVAPPPPPPPPPPTPEPPAPEPVVEKAPEPEPEPEQKEVETEKEIFRPSADLPTVKVVGKVDLEKEEKERAERIAAKKKEEEQQKIAAAEAKKAESKKAKETAKKETPPPVVEEPTKAPAKEVVKPEMVRHQAPKLKGLKIMGKVEIKKDPPKSKGNKSTDQKKSGGPGQGGDGRRKRKRKKITAKDLRNTGKGRPSKKKSDEVQTVSQKEIDEKIKATMARMSGGGKNKRQKIRRDNRADKREKEQTVRIN